MTKRRIGSDSPSIFCSDDYARLCAQGWDTVQEALALTPTPAFIEKLEAWQRSAQDIGDSLEGRVIADLNGQPYAVAAVGAKGGFRFRLENDDVLIFIGSPKRDWTISIRYLSAGLWEHGIRELRRRVFAALEGHTAQRSDDVIRVSRADWCFDFYTPQFRAEFTQAISGNVVAHSSVKKCDHILLDVWTCGAQGETLTIGKKTGLQIQLYNKSKEITDLSGKTWMYDIWASGLDGEWPWPDRPTDIFRLEVRFSGDFLKDRNIRRPGELNENLRELVAEALWNRRLTVPNGDANRARWPMHPLWERAVREFDAKAALPLGRMVTGRRDALVTQAVLQTAGALRSATVLAFRDYSDESRDQLIERARERIAKDPEHGKKILAAQARYRNVDEAN